MIVCMHPGFQAAVQVGRLTDEAGHVHAYTAEVKVHCAACGVAFRFLGMPEGLSPNVPTKSADGCEARLPLEPCETHPTAGAAVNDG